jgi:secondary thiamine-phosphate synthase enzyme
MKQITVRTGSKRQVIDVTGKVEQALHEAAAKAGVAHLHVLHTTAAVTTADLDPGTDRDYLDAFEAMIPRLHYRHPHNPAHVGDHISSAMVGTATSVPFAKGQLLLGTWQRIVLLEFDGPRERNLVVTLTPEA